MPGWYPDPGGAAGRFRFWDGAAWSPQTTADPNTTPPSDRSEKPQPPRKSDTGWIAALIVLLAVTLIAVGLFVFFGTRNPLGRGGTATADSNSSTPTVSAWNETDTPPPPPSGGGSVVACPVTTSTGNTRQVSGKLTADTLQVDQVPGWIPEGLTLDFTYDYHFQYKVIYPTWISDSGVALLSNADGFTDIGPSAEQIMECFASSGYYDDFSGRVDLVDEQTTISGHAAWHIESEIHIDDPTLPDVAGDVVDVIVVDLGGTKDHLGLYLSAYTIGDDVTKQQIQTAMATLTVTG
jgi:hypothetical protein